MALAKSATWTAISGSVGGVTFAKSAQGYYLRARTVPVDTNTSRQQAARDAMTSAVERYVEVLTETQRAGWETYAGNVLTTNPLGDKVNLSGQAWFLGSNVARIKATNTLYSPLTNLPLSVSPVDDAPTIFDRGEPGTVSIAASEGSGGRVDVTVGGSPAWLGEDGSFALFYLSRPRNASRKFFKGPYRLVGAVEGNSTTAPTFPVTLSTNTTLTYQIAAGQIVRVVMVVYRADGRYSSRIRSADVTVTA